MPSSQSAGRSPSAFLRLAQTLAVAVLTVCAALPEPAAAARARNPEDLMIVDCLLPGQVRKLGRMTNFMSARRPIRTTQSDCEIRGGEYVSYDRASYDTALKVWLAQAEAGDAMAQNYVGEIYQKGLGIAPDYAQAAVWYEKSAAQGERRAKINLGYLYEQGLGVSRDLPKALNLYREASGITGEDLVFASSVTVSAEAQAEISSLREQVSSERAETARLRAELDALRKKLDSRRSALDQAQRELGEARAKLEAEHKAVGLDQAPGNAALQAQWATREQTLVAERSAAERARNEQAARLAQAQVEIDRLKAQQAAAAAQPASAPKDPNAAAKQAEAARLDAELGAAKAQLAAAETQLSHNEKALNDERQRFAQERARMAEQLAKSESSKSLLRLLEQQLVEKEDEVQGQRKLIGSLEMQIAGVSAATAPQIAAAAPSGPVVEIIQPALIVTRGRPAAMAPISGTLELVGTARALTGLASLTINGEKVTAGADGMFRSRVKAQAADTVVAVIATDRNGLKTAVEFLLVQRPNAVAQQAATPASQTTARKPSGDVGLGTYHALVIGNDAYKTFPRLQSAVADAEAVASMLSTRYGFKTTLVKNADRFQMLSALNEMREKLGENDNLVVYYAGHGELDSSQRQGFWLPVDAQADTPRSWISNAAVSDILNTMSSRHVLVVADSCYSGAMTRASVASFEGAMPANVFQDWVKAMSAGRSRTALTSGGIAPVPDAGKGGHSAFAKALLTALEDNNQLMPAQALFREVTASIALGSNAATLLQIPEYAPIQFAGHEAGEFFFRPVSNKRT